MTLLTMPPTQRLKVALALIVCSLALLAALPGGAAAHKPIIEDRDASGYGHAIYVADPDVSWGLYGFLGTADDVDFYAFDVRDRQDLSTNILVPVKGVYRAFRPSYAIVGPGVMSRAPVPFEVPPGMGALVVDMPADSGQFYEPFGGVSYWQSPVNHTMLDRPGRYYVAVFDRGRAPGDYVLAIGDKESFGLCDLPGVLWTTLRIRFGVWDHSEIVSRGR